MADSDDLHDRRILGGSHEDRILGILIQQIEKLTEQVSTLKDSHQDFKTTVMRFVDRFEDHTVSDQTSFSALTASNLTLGTKLETLSISINSAVTAGIIQKVQVSTAIKVLAAVGAICAAVWTVGWALFNHKW